MGTVIGSRRLRSEVGAPLDALTADGVHGLVARRVGEWQELDFKEAVYGTNDEAKRELASDVAAMANSLGGLILLGVVEDDEGVATAAPGVDASDAEVQRHQQVVNNWITPFVPVEIRPIRGDDGIGFIAIVIPQSAGAPHLVRTRPGAEPSFRVPRRSGTLKRWLSEPEIAAAYRDRFRSREQQEQRLRTLAASVEARAERSDALVMTAVPSVRGHVLASRECLSRFGDHVCGRSLIAAVEKSPVIHDVRVGSGRLIGATSRRLRLEAGGGAAAIELHLDGAVTLALNLRRASGNRTEAGRSEHVWTMEVDDIVSAVITGLHLSASLATEIAGATGDIDIAARIMISDGNTALGVAGDSAASAVVSASLMGEIPRADATASLGALSRDPRELLVTASYVANSLANAFGETDLMRVSTDGSLRREYWGRDAQNWLDRWSQRLDDGSF